MGKECPYQYGLQDMILPVFADLSLVPDTEDINNELHPLSLQHFIIFCWKNQCSLKFYSWIAGNFFSAEIKNCWEMINEDTVVII